MKRAKGKHATRVFFFKYSGCQTESKQEPNTWTCEVYRLIAEEDPALFCAESYSHVYVTKWSRTNTESAVASVCAAGSRGLYFLVDGGWTTINPRRRLLRLYALLPPAPSCSQNGCGSEHIAHTHTHTLYPCCASTTRACTCACGLLAQRAEKSSDNRKLTKSGFFLIL